MTNMYRGEDGSHWYYSDGRPCYEIPLKTDPSRLRAPTVRDARELNLWPGATIVLRMMDAPALNVYKVNQHILATMTLPRMPGESEASFMARVLKDAKQHGEDAANFGTRIHDYAEWMIRGEEGPEPIRFMSDFKVLAGLKVWLKNHPITPLTADLPGGEVKLLEYGFCNPELGFGGRIDCIGVMECLDGCGLKEKLGDWYGEPMIIDFKSQETKPDLDSKGRPTARHHQFRKYPNHKMQGAAYSMGLGMPDLVGACVYVSRSVPGLIELSVTPPVLDDAQHWRGFQACKLLFYSYGPGSSLAYEWSEEEIEYFEGLGLVEGAGNAG